MYSLLSSICCLSVIFSIVTYTFYRLGVNANKS